MTIRSGRKAALAAAAVVTASGLLAGCMGDPFRTTVATNSPAASSIQSAMHQNLAYPKWSHFPAAPTDVPTPADFKGRALSLQESQAATLADAQGIQWTLSGTEEWATAARSEINPALAAPVSPGAAADTQAFVDAARKAATPPPAPK